MRVFFGLELPPNLALQISTWRDRQFGHCGRPVPVANFHITLAFAGELATPDIDSLCDSVDQWLAARRGVGGSLRLDQTGYWPNPGIYWLGPTQWPESLTAQARKLGHLVAAVGARRERKRFQPHITLFRRCRVAPPMPAQPPIFTLEYSDLALFESRQLREGVSYHVLEAWRLSGV